MVNILGDVARAAGSRLSRVDAAPAGRAVRIAARMLLADGLATADAVASLPGEVFLAYVTAAEDLCGVRRG